MSAKPNNQIQKGQIISLLESCNQNLASQLADKLHDSIFRTEVSGNINCREYIRNIEARIRHLKSDSEILQSHQYVKDKIFRLGLEEEIKIILVYTEFGLFSLVLRNDLNHLLGCLIYNSKNQFE